jgi:hypothetical protein
VLLAEFKNAVESRAIDGFWRSRRKGQLRAKPEKLAQVLLAVFAKAVVGDSGLVLRELASGIGFVDVGITFGGPIHLIELKILTGRLIGVEQLATYMRTEHRKQGWLLLLEARKSKKSAIPDRFETPAGSIRTIVVDINPVAPHEQ